MRRQINSYRRDSDDDDVEIKVLAKLGLVNTSSSTTSVHVSMAMNNMAEQGHGLSISGDPACCKLGSEGIYDCTQCIHESYLRLNDWPERRKNIAFQILQRLEHEEEKGIEIGQLKVCRFIL